MSRFKIVLILLCCCGTLSAQTVSCVSYQEGPDMPMLCHNLIIHNLGDTLRSVVPMPTNNNYLDFNVESSSAPGKAVDIDVFGSKNVEDNETIVYTVQQDGTGQLHLYNNIIIKNSSVFASTNVVSPDPSNMLQDVNGVFMGMCNFNLSDTSLAINAGDNQFVTWPDDIQGLGRIACQGTVDQGAFEKHPEDRTITLSATTEQNDNCSGHTTTIVATGGDRYEWSHSNETSNIVTVNPLVPTCYTVTAYWGVACERSDTATICVDPTEVVDNNIGSPSTSGQRFWVSFMRNYSGTSALSLLVSAQTSCTGTISNPNTDWSTNFSVSANQTTQISIPNAQAYCATAGTVGNFGLLVTATDTISLYASNFQAYTYDVTDVLPEPALSTDYIVQTYTPLINSEFLIVATQNATTVKITPSKTTSDNHSAFVPYTVTLNAGQTYQVISKYNGINGDLSGSTIQSLDATKPIAVFNGNVCTNVPTGNPWCDHVVEQAFGTHFWGRQFVITNTVGMPYDVVKVTASADNTVLTKNGNYLTTLQANGSYEFQLTSGEVACHLEGSNACAVYLYVAGGNVNTHDNYRGDPAMVWMSPLEQRIHEITFSTFNSTNITAHHVNVVVPTSSVSSVTCDGVSVANQFHPVAANPTYSYARLHISNGTHTLNSSQGFVAHVYGTGHCETYAYSCGSKAALLSQQMYVNNVLSTELENNNFCAYEDIIFDAAVNYQCDSVVWNFGDSYDNYNGMHFTHHYIDGGTYPVSMTVFMHDSYGQHCTTIYSQVVIHDGDNRVFYDTICQGEAYNAYGFSYLATNPGSVSLTRTVDVPGLDCDSTYVLELFVKQRVFDVYDTICAGNNYSDYGFSLPQANQGAYLLADTVVRGSCDSITVLHLLVTPNTNDLYGIHGMEYVCPGGVYTYWLDTLSGLTNIVWTMPAGAFLLSGQGTDQVEVTFTDDAVDANITALGMNSCGTASFSLTIHPKPIYYVQLTDTVCGVGQPYHRYDFDIDSVAADQTVFVHNMVSESCCDSTILLTLIVVELPETQIQSDAYQFCQNDVATLTALCVTESIDWTDSLYSTMLNYQWSTGDTSKTIMFTTDTTTTVGVTITNRYGCSVSADTLLTIYPPQTIYETLVICENQFPYEWRDTVFALGTVSSDIEINRIDSHGCDSTVLLHVEVAPVTSSEITETVYAQTLPYVLNDSVYIEAGDYVQHLVNQNGCDSTLTLHLIVETALLVVVDSTICEGELPFTWNGVIFTSAGTDTVTLESSAGIDSLVVMNLSVKPMSYVTDTQTACDSLTWIDGITYYQSTDTATFTMTAANGCDSVVTLHLTINPPTHTATTVTECESYTWSDGNGQTYTASGEYFYSHQDTNGCMQVDTLHLTINNPTHTVTNVTACESYTWAEGNGQTYNLSGEYLYSHQDINGCQQVDTLHLTINNPTHAATTVTECESYTWADGNGQTYTISGEYLYTHQDTNGCQQVDTLHLIINNPTHAAATVTECESYTWADGNGQTYTISGEYFYSHQDSNGCQQVDTLHLTINNPVHTSTAVTTYDSFTWTDGNNETYNQSGIYYYAHNDSNGCEQVDTLFLTIYNSSTNDIFATFCESYEWDGEIYTQSGDYERVYTNIYGADSTVTLHLIVNYGTHNVETESSCESYEWHGLTCDSTGIYVFEYNNADNCPSADTLFFTQKYAQTTEFAETACESYNWNDSTYYESGDYIQTFIAANGCDSVVTLHLIVHHGTHNVETEATCETFEWHGQTCDTTGRYVFEYNNDDGCPSVDTLYFTRKYAKTTELTETVCDSYTWNDSIYYTSGDYTQTFSAANGCDSVVMLHLIVNHPTNTLLTVNECVRYTWADGDGQTYTESGEYFYSHADSNGCMQVDTLHLTILPTTYDTVNLAVVENNMPLLYNDSTYYEAGTYTQYLTNAAGCDSILTVVLSVYENVTNFADSVVCESDLPILWNGVVFSEAGSQPVVLTAGNGADSVVVMTLVVIPTTYGSFDTTIVENALPLQYNDSTYFAVGTYIQYLTNTADCDSILTLNLTTYPNVTVEIDSSICEGELPIIWNDSIFTDAGVKTTTILASTGADSTITMTLMVIPTTYGTLDTAVIENALPYHYNDSTYAGEGTYTQYFTNSNGCDSILILNLTVYSNVTAEVDSAVCETDFPFTWNDSVFTEAGTKTTVILAHTGADSTITMTVTMIPTTYDTVEIAIVENNLPYQYNDSIYIAAGTYTQYLTNSAGCDSILTLTLTVFYNVAGVDDSTVCASELPLTWNGVTFTAAGVQTATLSAASGADSVVTMTLTVNPLSYTSIDTAVIQNNLPFHYTNGLIDTTFSAGTPLISSSQFIFTNTDGCDSIVSLNLTIYQNVTNTVDTMVCVANLPYTWHGHTFTAAGSHVVTLLTSHGADSVVTYMLSVNNIAANIGNVTHVTCYGTSTGAATATVTGGQSPFTYQWTNASGSAIAATTAINNCSAGTYTFTVTDHLGCTATATATINTLNDELAPGTIAASQEVCDDEDIVPFTGSAATGGDNGLYQWQVSSDGADWTTAPGTNNAQGYTYPNLATVSFSLRRAWVSQSCGTVYSNVVTVSVWPSSSDTVTANVCQGEGYDGYGFDIPSEQTVEAGELVFEQHYTTGHCDSAVILLLSVHPQYETETEDIICEGDGYSANGFVLSPQETVGEGEIHRELTLQSEHGCDSVIRLTLTVIDTALRIVPLSEDFCDGMFMELMVVTPMPDYVWSTGEQSPNITVTTPGFYSVTATQGDCSASARVMVEGCKLELVLPNAITPSKGDGLNDWFCLPEAFSNSISEFEISIFNRWGEQVYYSTDKNFKWKGEFRGKITYNTIYNYVIRYKDTTGRPILKTGSVTVL